MKLILLAASLTLIFGASAVKIPGQKPKTSKPVSLRVTIENLDSELTSCAICNDGGGDYIDGIDGVDAFISRYGYFYFSFKAGATARRVSFDYSSPYELPVPLPSSTPPGGLKTGEFHNFKIDDAYINLQDMQIGAENAQCVCAGWGIDSDPELSLTWNNNFHRTGSVFHDQRTAYALVTCTEAGINGECVKWEFEPKKHYLDSNQQQVTVACNDDTGQIASVAGVYSVETRKNKLINTYYGLYKLPFKLTLTRK